MDIADGTVFLAFCEAVLRENPSADEILDKLYREGRVIRVATVDPEVAAMERQRAIQKAMHDFR